MRLRLGFVLAAISCAAVAHAQTPSPDGADLYKRNCAQCHDNGTNRAPNRDSFKALTAERVLAAMETGSMITMANNRTAPERRAIAEFLTGKAIGSPLVTAPPAAAMCAGSSAFNPTSGPRWTGWGQNTSNTRFQDATGAGLTAADVPKLKLKWAFAFPGDLQSYAQSTIAGGRIFVGSWGGKVYSLNAATGCIHWFFDAGQGVRSAISVGRVGNRDIAVFGDAQANLYALDAATGRLLWKTDVDDFPVGRISGSPTLYNGRIYVGTASGEEASGANPAYECCKFRGSVVAVNAADGKILWKTYTVEQPKPQKKNAVGTQLWGHRVHRYGRRRRSTQSSIASMSRPATTTAIRRRRRAIHLWRSIWTQERSCGRSR
jgi:polyvinyl alcohol dehydrogenase (cytochrome)